MIGTAPASGRFACVRARGPHLLLAAAILAAAIVVLAPEQSSARTPRPAAARHHQRHRQVRQAARQPFRLRLPAADDFSDSRGGGRDVSIASPPPIGDRPPTAIDYRLAPRGPVGSLGLLRPDDTHAAQRSGLAATLRRGYPEVTAGAKLSYPF